MIEAILSSILIGIMAGSIIGIFFVPQYTFFRKLTLPSILRPLFGLPLRRSCKECKHLQPCSRLAALGSRSTADIFAKCSLSSNSPSSSQTYFGKEPASLEDEDDMWFCGTINPSGLCSFYQEKEDGKKQYTKRQECQTYSRRCQTHSITRSRNTSMAGRWQNK